MMWDVLMQLRGKCTSNGLDKWTKVKRQINTADLQNQAGDRQSYRNGYRLYEGDPSEIKQLLSVQRFPDR